MNSKHKTKSNFFYQASALPFTTQSFEHPKKRILPKIPRPSKILPPRISQITGTEFSSAFRFRKIRGKLIPVFLLAHSQITSAQRPIPFHKQPLLTLLQICQAVRADARRGSSALRGRGGQSEVSGSLPPAPESFAGRSLSLAKPYGRTEASLHRRGATGF